MDAKLTLKLDQATIRRAKAYAAGRNRSLLALVEGFFRALADPGQAGAEDPPIVGELAGIIEPPADDYRGKDTYADHLERRYR